MQHTNILPVILAKLLLTYGISAPLHHRLLGLDIMVDASKVFTVQLCLLANPVNIPQFAGRPYLKLASRA